LTSSSFGEERKNSFDELEEPEPEEKNKKWLLLTLSSFREERKKWLR